MDEKSIEEFKRIRETEEILRYQIRDIQQKIDENYRDLRLLEKSIKGFFTFVLLFLLLIVWFI